MSDEFSDIGSVKALLSDARERIKESEGRSKEAIDRTEVRLNVRLDEHESLIKGVSSELAKWTPLLTTLQASHENKKTLVILLVSSFITNLATIVVTIFIYFAKSGVLK